MNYQQILPTERLRKYVRYFWALEDNSLSFPEKTFKIMSDGLPGLIFQENPQAFVDENDRSLPQAFLYGQTTRYTEHKSNQPFRNIGVYFQPDALKSVFGIDANELTNRHINITELVNTNLTDQLLNNFTTEQRIELLSSFLIQQVGHRKVESGKVNFAIARLQKGASLPTIQNDLNLSERSLERYFKQHIGISPKLYARISRFQSALESVRQTRFNSLTEVAYLNDYFDQSHFIREFQEFAGTSPKHFIRNANEQVANFPEWKI